MPGEPTPNKWVRIDLPPEFRIGIVRFAELCGWRTRVSGDGSVMVVTEERYRNSRPRLLRLTRVADAANAHARPAYERFAGWHRQDAYGGPELLSQVQALREVRAPADVVDGWVAFRLQFMTMPDSDVPEYLHALFSQVVEGARNASLWALEIDQRFRWRVAAVRALFAAREAPEVLLRKDSEQQSLRFFSSAGLSQAWTFGLAVFTEPVLLAASPWITGISSYRAGGSAVIAFGEPQSAFSGRQATEGLDLFKSTSLARPRTGASIPSFPPSAYEAALTWWVARLNDLAGIVLDVGHFSDAKGNYQPAAHLGVLLSIERLFASVQTILAEARGSELVRLAMFFDVIDILDGLSFGSWESLLTRTRVERDLERLRPTLPDGARDYLLTRCVPALEALRSMEDGFALRERIQDGKLRVRERDGTSWRNLSLVAAVPQYLRIARNSSHSFRKMAKDPREVSLMAAHDGDIPDAISDLAFLHLLRFMSRPHIPTS